MPEGGLLFLPPMIPGSQHGGKADSWRSLLRGCFHGAGVVPRDPRFLRLLPGTLGNFPGCTQTHIHRVGDAIQPSHPPSSPSLPAPNLFQHQGLSNESTFCIMWPKYCEFPLNLARQSSRLPGGVTLDLYPQGSEKQPHLGGLCDILTRCYAN